MDIRHLSARARDIGEVMRVFLDDVAKYLKQTHEDQNAKLQDGMDQTIARITAEQSEREAATRSHVSKQAKAVREDVTRHGEEVVAAFEHRITALRAELRAEVSQAVSSARGQVTEEIATANRSTHDTLVAKIDSALRKK